ncbi:MAG: DedA family protein [Chloroherpetonaceae bacterium]|nr:DedA family protein [Chloroherpetonaceae bacterium]
MPIKKSIGAFLVNRFQIANNFIMLNDLIELVGKLDNNTIYIFLFLIAYFENVIPPIPGDLPVAFVGSLIAIDDLSPLWCLLSATLGSVLGFATMYFVGFFIGMRFYAYGSGEESGKIQHGFAKAVRDFFPPESLDAVKLKFTRYGYWLIIANRFMTGSRAIISIAAGISHLHRIPVLLCASLSALTWNILLLYGGYVLGDNWEALGKYISTYGLIFTVLVLGVIGFFGYRYLKTLKIKNAKSAKLD